ncbi:MAG TPA: lytic transglycosylase domain-containing protein [Thermoanaerobaculia bacterium]|nr:lytic transglycosylase domain-containing protein [Thermoanaerobaculia bacterium]
MNVKAILQSVAFTALVAGTFATGIDGVEEAMPVTTVKAAETVAAAALSDLTTSTTIETAAAAGPEWDLPNLDHSRVDYWVERFTTDKRHDFAAFLERKDKFAPMILTKLNERGMPADLLYLAMIESGFNPNALSPANAVGLWQFIEPTAERYGLTVTRKVDERKDPEKATEAALSYLSDLHARFGSWYLAAAAYNTGENRVGRIMRQVTGSERGSEDDYYAIADLLPRETADYVPLMIAAARISKEPQKYGFGGDQS